MQVAERVVVARLRNSAGVPPTNSRVFELDLELSPAEHASAANAAGSVGQARGRGMFRDTDRRA